jgi:hypothetical protein
MSLTIEPHPSAKYAVTRTYAIVAVHALNMNDPDASRYGSTLVLASKQLLTSGGAHVWAPPDWILADDIVAFCQTTEAANKYRTYIREQDREADGA